MYTLRAIVLSKQFIRDNQIRVILFTEEYGKITAWTKKTYSISDIGALIEVLIERKNQENIIHHITPLCIPKNENWNYQTTFEFLTLLQIMKESLPEGMGQKEIYDDTKEIITYLSNIESPIKKNNNELFQLFILTKARLLKKQGFLREEFFENSEFLTSIFRRLDIVSMNSMIYSKEIKITILKDIETAILEGIHNYKNRI